ncbi:MAG: 3'(2'),5'-bisphosphate nucleotidase CysQ [Gammaproteobacteria bacterium]
MTDPDDCPIADPCALLEPVCALARAAGTRILEVYATDFGVDHKDDRSPLTAADLASHHAIIDGLRRLTPDVPALSEESARIPYAERASWRCYWLIDPLDGTREFVKRNGEFTVNIALIRDHTPVLGVVHVPVSGTSYYACAGRGAFKEDLIDGTRQLRARSVPTDRITVAGSRSHRGASLDALLARLGEHELIGMGSSLKFCLVAEGRADLYPRLGPTSEWDTAAAHCVVEEAGGRVTDTALQPLRYNTKESLLNPHFLVFGDPNHPWHQYLV